jgi:putative phosphoribosyl transferase
MVNEKDCGVLNSAARPSGSERPERAYAVEPGELTVLGSGRRQHMSGYEREIKIPVGIGAAVYGTLRVPPAARGFVIFAHGSGSSRDSPRNRLVAEVLERDGFATLLMNLLTEREATVDDRTAEYRFDIPFLAQRLALATDAARGRDAAGLLIGYFGASTGAAAALVAAACAAPDVAAIVSRGGRPDLAGDALAFVRAPKLLIVGSGDPVVWQCNREACRRMRGPTELVTVKGATHLFEEPGALERVAGMARDWFVRYLTNLPSRVAEQL